MKYDTYHAYDPRATSQSLPTFLTIWPALGRYHDDLVLLGGLVPTCICKHPESAEALPRPATLDVDLGIALGASAGQYGTLSSDLSAQGFRVTDHNKARYTKEVDGFEMYIDFLVEDGANRDGARMVDDVQASVMPGVVRALESARSISLSGQDLFGIKQNITARVCEVGPYLALKFRAFKFRQQPKDAFDILYTVKHYDRGADAAIASFQEEIKLKNAACPDALDSLRSDFKGENSAGAIKAAHFVLGEANRSESEDIQLRRTLIRQDMVDIANALLA
ncbi:MAG: hypothetical protein ABF379_16935 [Akkermansiaceae bacterium]